MGYAVGIDLGTTNSVISVCRRGVPCTLLVDGRSTMPSVISFRDDGNLLVGQAAKARMLLDPETTVVSVKRSIGEHGKVYHIGRKEYSPIDISSLILKRLVEAARKELGSEVLDAVITVPAYFTEAQRQDTKLAGEQAGLNVLRLIPEPTAAAIAYGLDKGKDQTILVYDLGGGTFDVSILTIHGNRFDVKAVGGDCHLGGDDFDQAIVEWAAGKFKQQTGIDLLHDKSLQGRQSVQRLKEAAEAAKIELSLSASAIIEIPDVLGRPLSLEISINEYNKLIAPLLKHTVDCLHAVMRDAHMRPDDIDRVILVGGSTKNRAVQDIVSFEVKDPYIADRVDEVVSHGAAILAANMYLPDEDNLPIEVSNVTAHSLGINMMNADEELYFRPIIQRQTTYPCKFGVLGSTRYPDQDEVIMTVYRGESPDPAQNTSLGELNLPISPPSPEIVPVAAIFELDADGIIHFTAVQLPLSDEVIEYITDQNEKLDVAAVEKLIQQRVAKAKTILVKSID